MTLSAAGVWNPALRRSCSARAASPVACSEAESVCVPTVMPRPIATATNATQSAIAVFQFFALHRPARAARFIELIARTPLPVAALKCECQYRRRDYSNETHEVKFRKARFSMEPGD